jgi:hypothetical protein
MKVSGLSWQTNGFRNARAAGFFSLVSTVSDTHYQPGELTVVDDSFVTLPPLMTVLDKSIQHEKEITVELMASMTAVGTLQVQCVAVDHDGSWALEFQLRSPVVAVDDETAGGVLPQQFPEALLKIDEVYGRSDKSADKKAVKALRVQLEKQLGKKVSWHVPC